MELISLKVLDRLNLEEELEFDKVNARIAREQDAV